MPESRSHRHLVSELVKYIAKKHCEEDSTATIAIDTQEDRGIGKPPLINGHVPDVYVNSVKSMTEVIGEAKPASDIQSRRTLAQYEAFIDYASKRLNCEIIIAVPWHSVSTTKNMMMNICRRKICAVNFHVIEGLGDEPYIG